MAVVGIDLGTTNTVVAAVRDGRAAALKDKLGKALLPSVVSFPPKGEPKIGYEARDRRTIDPENTVFSVKRLIGRTWDSEHVRRSQDRYPYTLKEGPGKAVMVSCRGQDYSLPEISALVLGAAKEIAEGRLGRPVSDAVITVPANFNDLQRAATKVAGRTAGLQVLRILNEPTAAALAYGFGKKGRERIAVYDFGGGTFDVTLLDLSENVFEVLATAGDTFLGGDDLDTLIMEQMAEELLRQLKIDAGSDPLVREQLRVAAEKLKIDLSTRSMSKVRVEDVGLDGGGFEFTMRRSEFERLAEPLVSRSLEVCQEALDVAGVTPKDLDQVLLVGGSTRIPLVRRRISTFFGKMPQSRINPDEVVAIGAAIQASALESKMATSELPGAPLPASQPPGARTSAFPASPAVGARKTGTTQTGLAGLKQTMPGTGSVRPSAPPRMEGAGLGGLPKAPTQPPGKRPLQDTLSGVGAVPPAPGASLNVKPGPMKTLSGVGGPGEPATPGAARLQLGKTLGGVGPARGTSVEVEGPRTLPGVGAEARGPRTLTGIGKPPAAEQLAQLGSAVPPPPLEDSTVTAPPSLEESFDDVTQIVALPDERALLADEAAAASERDPWASDAQALESETLEPEVGTTDGSVAFDLAELEASEAARRPEPLDEADVLDGSFAGPLPTEASPHGSPGVAATAEPGVGALLDDASPGYEELSGVSELFEEESADLPSLSVHPPAPAAPETTPERSAKAPERPVAGGLAFTQAAFDEPEDLEAGQTDLPSLSERPPAPAKPDVVPARPAAASEPEFAMPLRRGRPSSPPPRGSPGGPPAGLGLDAAIGEALKSHPDLEEALAREARGRAAPASESSAVSAAGRPPLLVDVTPLSLGVETVGGFVDTLIERNSPVPCERTRTFATARDDQTVVRVRVSQGDANRFEENTVLGEVELTGLAKGPRGSVKIDVTFALDESGMLQVSARDKRTGIAANARLRLMGFAEAY
jgi:molecular chaperone DnaK